MLAEAHRRGLFTKPFCTSPEEAVAMAEAGGDNLIVHFGNSSGGSIGSKTVVGMDEAAERAAQVCDALGSRYSSRIVTFHGGAFETPSDVEELLRIEPRLDGYVGGSSAERFPIEQAVPEATRRFKALSARG
jgi:predicted TIM-barrel enzyme